MPVCRRSLRRTGTPSQCLLLTALTESNCVFHPRRYPTYPDTMELGIHFGMSKMWLVFAAIARGFREEAAQAGGAAFNHRGLTGDITFCVSRQLVSSIASVIAYDFAGDGLHPFVF